MKLHSILTRNHLAIATLAAGSFFLTTSPASAALVTFSGADPGVAAGGARPISNAAAASFQAATFSLSTIDFEGFSGSAVAGDLTNFSLATGVSVTTTGLDSGFGRFNQPNDIAYGYNTTSGGSVHFDYGAVSAMNSETFSFATPIDAFGAYLTGLGTGLGTVHVTFLGGASQDLTVAGSSMGGVQFFGFTDAGQSISSVQFSLSMVNGRGDVFGVDDVQYGSAVPEPTTALFGLALVGFCTMALRVRHFAPFARGGVNRGASQTDVLSITGLPFAN